MLSFISDSDLYVFFFLKDVLSFTTCTGRSMGLPIAGDAGITELNCLPPEAISDIINRPWNLIYGLVAVSVKTEPGGAAAMEFFLPERAVYGEWPYGVFVHDPDGGWRKMGTASFNDHRDRVMMQIADGGEWDADGTADGSIDIRFGLGIIYDNVDRDNGSGGGCFLSTTKR